MIVEYKLIELEGGAEEATLVSWLKSVGDSVEVGEPLLEVMTEKVNIELASDVKGVIVELCVEEEAVIEPGDVIAKIEINN